MSVPPLGQAAGVGSWKTNISVTHEEGRSYIFCMIPFPFDARPCPSIPKGIGRGPKAREQRKCCRVPASDFLSLQKGSICTEKLNKGEK